MKKITLKTFLLFMSIIIASCKSIHRIGDLNIVSNRNYESKEDYVLLKTYAGESKKIIKKSNATTVEMAIDNVVKSVPGGEFIKNAKIYLIVKGNKYFFAVEGDIWGIKQN